MSKSNVFATLSAIDCSAHIEKKGTQKYLSWAWAWKMVKDNFPNATYTVYENAEGIPYHTDGRYCFVKTGVTIEGIEHIEYLPVLDYSNKSIKVENVTSFDVNKAIQRSLTKACARHGLGLYIYGGEDMPTVETDDKQEDIWEKIAKAGSVDELTTIYNDYELLHNDDSFMNALSEAKQKLINKQQ